MTESIKTPLRRVRGLGAARTGTDHFWTQRLTAIANIPLVLAFVAVVILVVGRPYAEARAILAYPVVSILIILLVLSAVNHMRIGMQVIIEDYVTGHAKVPALIANTFFAAVIGLASIYAILRIGFGT